MNGMPTGKIQTRKPPETYATFNCTLTNQFERCYQKASAILGPTAEPISVAMVVESHRRYWRPKSVHTVLLASLTFTRIQTNVWPCADAR